MPIERLKRPGACAIGMNTRAATSWEGRVTDTQSHIVLFNDARYQRCNIGPGQRLLRYDHVIDGRLVGTLSGVVEDGLLDCGHSAPFGGIDWVRRREPVGSVARLLQGAVSRAREQGMREIRVRARPAYYGENESSVEFALRGLGASVESCEISLGIEAWRYRTSEEYVAALDSSSRNMLTQARRAVMVFDAAKTASDWAACYELLAATKRRRGARFSVPLDYLLRLRDIFETRIVMRRLMLNDKLAGAALVYRVAPAWDYVAAWGDELAHRDKRVMNAMAYHLVREAIAQRVAVVDIGISSAGGVADDGLIQFKRSIGATTGLRINFLLPVGRSDHFEPRGPVGTC